MRWVAAIILFMSKHRRYSSTKERCCTYVSIERDVCGQKAARCGNPYRWWSGAIPGWGLVVRLCILETRAAHITTFLMVQRYRKG